VFGTGSRTGQRVVEVDVEEVVEVDAEVDVEGAVEVDVEVVLADAGVRVALVELGNKQAEAAKEIGSVDRS